jgi:Flp pilus assembly pilin Flp
MVQSPGTPLDRGASTVEYGLLVAGIVAAFLLGAVGLQGAVGAMLGHAVSKVERNDTPSVIPSP